MVSGGLESGVMAVEELTQHRPDVPDTASTDAHNSHAPNSANDREPAKQVKRAWARQLGQGLHHDAWTGSP